MTNFSSDLLSWQRDNNGDHPHGGQIDRTQFQWLHDPNANSIAMVVEYFALPAFDFCDRRYT
jgi:hypothetical protein